MDQITLTLLTQKRGKHINIAMFGNSIQALELEVSDKFYQLIFNSMELQMLFQFQFESLKLSWQT